MGSHPSSKEITKTKTTKHDINDQQPMI